MALIFISGAFVYWTGIDRDSRYHRAFVIAALIQIVIECFLVETIEWIWVYCVTPRLIASDIRRASAALKGCVEDMFLILEKEQVNVPEYFFVSTKLARHYPHLLEAAIVLSYQTRYLRNLSPTWAGYIDEWVDRSWDVDLDYALRLFFVLFQKWTPLRIIRYCSLLFGTFPIVYQRLLVRFFGLCVCGIIYIAVIYRENNHLLYILIFGAWVVQEVVAWFFRRQEKNKVFVSRPPERRKYNLRPLHRLEVAGAGSHSASAMRTKKSGVQRYTATSPVLNDDIIADHSPRRDFVMESTDECAKHEEKRCENLYSPSHSLSAEPTIAGAGSTDRYSPLQGPFGSSQDLGSIGSLGSAAVFMGHASSDDLLHVSLDDQDEGGSDEDYGDYYDTDTADENDDDDEEYDDDAFTTFYPSLQNIVQTEYSDVLNAIDSMLQNSSDSD